MCCRIRVLRFLYWRVLSFSRIYTLWHMSHENQRSSLNERRRESEGRPITFSLSVLSPPSPPHPPHPPPLPFPLLHNEILPPILLARTSPTVVVVRLGRRFVTQVGKPDTDTYTAKKFGF